MKPQFTPGPWVIRENRIESGVQDIRPALQATGHCRERQESANLHLAALAPEMLGAIGLALAFLDNREPDARACLREVFEKAKELGVIGDEEDHKA